MLPQSFFFSFQGFQVLCDLADGFAGLGSKVTELLHDSYGGRGILTWGLLPVSHPDSVSVSFFKSKCFVTRLLYLYLLSLFEQTPVKDLYRLLNCTLGMVHMASHSSLFCPLTLRGGLGRRPSSPTTFTHLSYDVRLAAVLLLCHLVNKQLF